MKDLDFSSLEPQVVSFSFSKKEYELREATGKIAKEFNNARTSRITFVNGKPSGLRNIGDLPSLLVQMCTFESDTGKNVPMKVVEEWPSKMVQKLYEKALEISDLKEDTSSAQTELYKALERSDSPVSMEQLRTWITDLPSGEFNALKELVEPTSEEKAKNDQSSTTDGSE